MRQERRIIRTENGYDLTATVFHPSGEPVGKVLIAPAMGTRQSYYSGFATWLAERGYLVATFDYSGTGESRVPDIRRMQVDLVDWARYDASAVLRELATMQPAKPLFWIGHSLGGQLLGLVTHSHRIAKAINIASGAGYWLESPLALQLRVWWLWYVVAPIATRVFGYFPGRKLRKVGDLPRGVMEQWRRWCLNPGYAIASEGDGLKRSFESVRMPIASLHVSDDELVSPANVATLLSMYSNAARTSLEILPGQVAGGRIGHFGFFKARFRESLWERFLLPELQTQSPC